MSKGPGDLFQVGTKYSRHNVPAGMLSGVYPPQPYKRYEDVPVLPLPEPSTEGGRPLWEVVRRRRSVRRYAQRPLTLIELSQLLWATQGITAHKGGYALRSAPSAGALYPVETYLVVNAVEEVSPGAYHYEVGTHRLAQLKRGRFGPLVAEAALGQTKLERCAVIFIWSAVLPRITWRYHQRSYRYIYLDAGHIAQNLALAAAGLDLGTCQIGAFFDDELNEFLALDGTDETVIYLSAVGPLP
ncbi:nitroreductase [Candidatus Desulforudis audaxviator MP104C]|uniref:Nitroreductase n=1 Tax=Desulforudis audaxviator (strain MP104C) TaxID=477974 RepID=B1I2I1_DESAP|nr:nitroreductase [Candidatus Desulforudis audaxviator MP104C]